jgi:hypothetical protein
MTTNISVRGPFVGDDRLLNVFVAAIGLEVLVVRATTDRRLISEGGENASGVSSSQ